MNLHKSISRLNWRFSKGNFTPNETDIESLNEIVDYVAKKEKQQLIDNQLFGKLYIFVLGEFIRHYESLPPHNIPQSQLHKLLDKDLKLIVDEFVGKANNAKLSHVTNGNSFKDYVPTTYDDVAGNLRVMINAAINTYS